MKKKIIIILTIIIAVVLVLIGFLLLNKKEEVTVKVFIRESFDKYNEIELTPEQHKEILKLYKKTNTRRKVDVKLAVLGYIKLEFSDGNVISMDDNNDSYGYINNEYCIRLAKGFKEYILNIIY